MQLDEVLAIINDNIDELRRRHVASLEVFGSVARDDAGPDSDDDVLVEFDGSPVGLIAFVDLKMYLEDILGREVELVERSSVIQELKSRIYGEAIRAA